MRKLFLTLLFLCVLSCGFAQENLPTDYLTKEFHMGRRDAFRSLMPANSVAVIFSYPERNFSNDVSYIYHPNPDMYYLTGYKEPNAVLLIFKETQGTGSSSYYNEVIFIRERNAAREIWTGRRLGVEGTKTQLGFTTVYNGSEFKNFPIDFKKFDKIIYDKIPTDIRDDATGF